VYNAESKTLILGTMPSPVSRENTFYYAHPRNRFWPVIAAVFDEKPPATKEDRINFAFAKKIALWDVLASCSIKGASDHTIQAPVPNDFAPLFRSSSITRVFTTGKKAAALYQKLCFPQTGIAATPLPSTSPANMRFSFESLVDAYRVLRT
jgi:hypoxanthine-DNA glycosylase